MIKKLFTFFKSRKKKSIVFFVSLVSLLIIGIPKIANAGAWDACIPERALGAILMGIASLLRLTYDFALLTGGLLNDVMDPLFLGHTITSFSAYYTAWASVRDIANMGIVLGFVFVGIATTLRIQEYAAQKKLFPLIMVAILINFTPLFCGLVIDSSNIIAKSLAGKTTTSTITGVLQKEDEKLNTRKMLINGYIDDDKCGYILDGSPETPQQVFGLEPTSGLGAYAYLKHSFLDAIYFLFSGVMFLILAGILAARYALLILLFIISPLAFFCIIFPFSKKYFDSWLSNFIKWSFVGVTSIFCIYLGNIVFAASSKGLLDVFISCIFLFVGFKLAMSSSGVGASIVTGLMAAAGGFALGAVKTVGGKTLGAMGGVAGAAAKQLPFSGAVMSAASSVSNSGGRFLESVGLRKVGVTATNQAKKVNEAKTRMDAMTDEEKAKFIQSKSATPNQIAGGMKSLATSGGLSKIDPKNLSKLTDKATKRGVDRDVFTKADASLAMKDRNNPTHHELDQVGHNINNIKTPERRAKALSQGSPQNLAAMSSTNVQETLAKASPNDRKKIFDSISSPAGKEANKAYTRTLVTKRDAAKAAGDMEGAKRFDEEADRHIANTKIIRTERAKMTYYKPPTPPASTASKIAGAVGTVAKGATIGAGAVAGVVASPKVTIGRAVNVAKNAGSAIGSAATGAAKTAASVPSQVKEAGKEVGRKVAEAGKKTASAFKKGYDKTSKP